jgi:uncharacterized protein YraI
LRIAAGSAAVALGAAGLGHISPASADFTGYYLTTAALNMRSEPNANSTKLLVVPSGAGVKYAGDGANGYIRVTYQGITGYVLGAYLTDTNGGSTDTPEFDGTGGTTTAVNFRSGPGTSYPVLRVLPAGTPVKISDTYQNGFRYVSHEGLAGWIYADYVGNAPSGGPVPATMVTTAALNLRSQPSTSARILLVMPRGATVKPTGALSAGFAEVTYNGTKGWAHTSYLA